MLNKNKSNEVEKMEGVVLEEANQELVEDTKKAKLKAIGKKVLVVAGIGASVVLGLLLVSKVNNHYDSETIELDDINDVNTDDVEKSDE